MSLSLSPNPTPANVLNWLILCFLLSCISSLLSSPCTARSISLELEKRQPKPLLPFSTRGFPQNLRIVSYEPDTTSTLPGFNKSQSAPLRWTSRYHNVQLHGGMVAVGEYYAKIKMGGQTVRVQIDTGSATLAFPLKECSNCKSGDMRYSVADSNSGKARYIRCEDEQCGANTCSHYSCPRCSSEKACCAKSDHDKCAFHLNFGDGSGAKGALVYDILSWGDLEFPVHAGGIMSDSPDFERSQVDGILGMAYPSLACNPTCIKPTFESMLQKYKDMKEMFTICITYDAGKIVLGDFDPALSTKPVTWIPLQLQSPATFYSFPLLGDLLIDNKTLPLPSYSAAIVDSGTTLIVFNHNSFDALKKYFTENFCDVPGLCGENSWFRPAHCTRIKDKHRMKLPTLVFRVKDFDIRLGPSEYLINYATKGRDFWCVGIMALDSISGGADVIFGNTVMKKYVTVYDRENSRVGFAESDTNCGNTGEGKSSPVLPLLGFTPKSVGEGDGRKHNVNDSSAGNVAGSQPEQGRAQPKTTLDGRAGGGKDAHKQEEGGSTGRCKEATNCSSCAAMKEKCIWDGGGQICVTGESFALMCAINNIADNIVYVIIIGCATAAAVLILVVAAFVIRKRNSTVETNEENEPLASETRDAFALEDESEPQQP